MIIRGQLRLDFKEYRQLIVSTMGPKVWILRLGGLLFAALSVVEIVSNPSETIGYVGQLVVAVVLMAITDLAVLIGWRRVAPLVGQPWRYEVSDTTLGIHTPQTEMTARWDTATRARTRRHAWIVKLATRSVVPIPRAAFTVEDAHQVDALVRARSGG